MSITSISGVVPSFLEKALDTSRAALEGEGELTVEPMCVGLRG